MSTYDSAPETLAHVRRVGDFLADATANLVRRTAKHDHSKVCQPDLGGKLADMVNGGNT